MGKSGPSSRPGAHVKGWALPLLGTWMSWTRQWAHWAYWALFHNLPSSRTISSVDIATKENLDNLVKVGEELLDKPVSRVNLDTGILEPTNQGTNREALSRYVTILVVFESSET